MADELIDALVAFTGAPTSRNASRWFYHDCYGLNSDNWEHPTGNARALPRRRRGRDRPSGDGGPRAHRAVLSREGRRQHVQARLQRLSARETSLYRRLRALEGDFASGRWMSGPPRWRPASTRPTPPWRSSQRDVPSGHRARRRRQLPGHRRRHAHVNRAAASAGLRTARLPRRRSGASSAPSWGASRCSGHSHPGPSTRARRS